MSTDHFDVIARGLCAPEGPTVGPAGWLLNVCSFTRDDAFPFVGGDIVATSLLTQESRVVLNTSSESTTGIPASLAFGPDEALYIADEGHRSILRVDARGEVSDLVATYRGERLNGSNDLSFDRHGNLFFTDPWTSSLENPIGAIYGYAWDTGTLNLIRGGLAFPNGIIARGDKLYAAETLTQKVFEYDITGPGAAENERVFCALPDVEDVEVHGPDGMAFDAAGRLYVAHFGGAGVHVYGPDGTYLRTIDPGGAYPTNVCFGGSGHSDLFITVDDTAELIRISIDGVGERINFCPSGTTAHAWRAMLAG